MTFWAYMLHCRGGYFYVGHTDDLDVRVAQHQYGEVYGFAAEHRPVELVWSQEFVTREEAKAAEKQIKGWSRAEKMALIRGDWADISRLAKGKDSPSTSSGKSVVGVTVGTSSDYPELVEGLSLLCHPDTPTLSLRTIDVTIFRPTTSHLSASFLLEGELKKLILPFRSANTRTDGLWQSTCFELFIRGIDKTAYCEFNFSPSGSWAAYRFENYRDGMRPLNLGVAPELRDEGRLANGAIFEARVTFSAPVTGPLLVALSAVIEERDGTKSYWALRHPPGRPDFHHPDCFALTLEAPPAA